jgi:ABC-type transport system substrate-binding protein
LIKLNFARYRSPEVDAALQAQRDTNDFETRKAEFGEIWSKFAEDVPYAFLVHNRTAWATKGNIYGLEGFTTPEGDPIMPINRWTPFYTGVFVVP